MYSTKSGLILGFHGCDEDVVHNVLNGHTDLKQSKNTYDWLGHGMYFWESSYSRALEFAKHLQKNPQQAKNPIKKPAVLGAVLNIGNCLDLLDYENLQVLKTGYDYLKSAINSAGFPQNKVVGDTNDLLLRDLDCAVIEVLHKLRESNDYRKYDSVRGVFFEGQELYPGAGFKEKDHIQICIRNPNCIKGFFLPRKLNEKHTRI